MSVLPPKKGSTKRRPGTKGLLLQDITRGVERSRAWPRKRGTPKSEVVREQNETFRQAQWAYKFQDAKIQQTIVEMTEGTPLMPRDLFLMMTSGRALAFQHPDEPTEYSMASFQDVSESLDVITSEEGYILRRGPQFWEGVPQGGGGGGGSAWTVIDDFTIASPIPYHDVFLSAYNDIMVQMINVTASASGNRLSRCSVDGGVTFYAANGDYTFFNNNGVLGSTVGLSIHATASAAARGGVTILENAAQNGILKNWNSQVNTSAPCGFFPASLLPVTHLRHINTAGNLTGGRIITLGR